MSPYLAASRARIRTGLRVSWDDGSEYYVLYRVGAIGADCFDTAAECRAAYLRAAKAVGQ